MSDDQPGSGVTHTVTLEIPPRSWNPQSWAEFKAKVKDIVAKYNGTITTLTFED